MEAEAKQQVLQTRFVAMDEFLRNLEEQKQVFEEEVNTCKVKAVEAIIKDQFQQTAG